MFYSIHNSERKAEAQHFLLHKPDACRTGAPRLAQPRVEFNVSGVADGVGQRWRLKIVWLSAEGL